ncbi:hypothetical protein V6N13_109324 [Hibiscus sabdariffa]
MRKKSMTRYWGRFRYFHALLDSRNDPDLVKLCNQFCQKLFEQPPKFTPWEHEIPGWFKICRDWEIFNYIESMCREARNKNVYKFLIVVKFGLFREGNHHHDFSDDVESDLEVESEEEEEEIVSVPVNKSSI